MDQLDTRSLQWALAHVLKFGDTDIFPAAFEYKAVQDSWPKIKESLSAVDLESYRPRAVQQMLMPKANASYRIATQLDPLDTLVFGALIHECAQQVERYRVPEAQATVCSNRISLQSDGTLFASESGWKAFHKKSNELALSRRFSHILSTDISDFYNQLSHHRINNVLQSAGIEEARSKSIESFLSRINARQSRGLPVGPLPAAVLAEAALDDVDKFLLARGLVFTRFVDDYRIFCVDPAQAKKAAHDLTHYLYTSHRLFLNGSKTKEQEITDFVNKELLDPQEQEELGKSKEILLVLEEILENTGYRVDFSELPNDDQAKVTRRNLATLFGAAIDRQPLSLGLAKYLIGRATQLETASIRQIILANLRYLAPVMREIVQYLIATTKSCDLSDVGQALSDFAKADAIGTIPFVRRWILEFFIQRPESLGFREAIAFSSITHDSLGLRPDALLAGAHKEVQWIRSHKESWANHAPWDRRAIIFSSKALPKDERKKWCQLVRESTDDQLDQAVAILAANG
jgi:hypothetical protein